MLYQLSYFRIPDDGKAWAVMDSNHRRRKPAELQSAPFGHSGNCPYLFFAVQRYKLFLNCANGTAHLQCCLRCFGTLVAQATACTLFSLLRRFGRQDAEDDGRRSRAESMCRGHIQLRDAEGHTLTDVVEVRGVPTDDTADSDDGVHSVVQQARRSIDELEGPWYTEDGDLLYLLLAEHFESTLEQGFSDVVVPLRYSDADVQPFPRGDGAVVEGLDMVYRRHGLCASGLLALSLSAQEVSLYAFCFGGGVVLRLDLVVEGDSLVVLAELLVDVTSLDEAAGRDRIAGSGLSSSFVALDSFFELAELYEAVTDHALYRGSDDGFISGELLQLSQCFLILTLVIEADTAVGVSEVRCVCTGEVLGDSFEAWRTSTLTLEGEAVLPSDEAVFCYEHLCGSLLSLRDLDEAVVSEDAESDDDDSRYCDDDLLAVALEEEFTLQYLLIDGVEGVVLWELVM